MGPMAATAAPSAAAECLGNSADAQLHDHQQRLEDDAAAHLRMAGHPLAEDDRHLHDLGAAPMRPPGHFDLEAIAAGVSIAQADRLQELAAPCLEATGQVAVREQQHGAREKGAGPADQLPMERPAHGAAASDVAAAQAEV